MREAFALQKLQKLLTFFQQKILVYYSIDITIWNFDKTLTSSEQPRPGVNSSKIISKM